MIPSIASIMNAKMGVGNIFHLIANTDGVNVSGSIDTSGSNLIVLAVCGESIDTVSDSKFNTWIPLTQYSNGGVDTFVTIYYCYNPTVGAGHTFTNSRSYGWIGVEAFDNSASSPFDQENGAGGNGITSKQGGSVTPSLNKELIISAVGNGGSASTQLINSGFTKTNGTDAVSGINYGGALSYKIQTTLGAENPTWSWAGSATGTVANATFKVA